MYIAVQSDNALWCGITQNLLTQNGWQLAPNTKAASIVLTLNAQNVHITAHGHSSSLVLPVAYGKLQQHLTNIWHDLDPLTDKERAIVQALQQAGAAGLSTTQMLKTVWQHHTDAHTVATHINRLRLKLKHGQIATLNGVYFWQA